MPERNIVEAINNALSEEMEQDPRVMVLGLDVGKLGGVFRTTGGLVERCGGARVVDTPLAEAGIIGASLGLALAGMVPVAEIQFLGFSAQGFHQIGPQLGKDRQRSRGSYNRWWPGGPPLSFACARRNGSKTKGFQRRCWICALSCPSTWRRCAARSPELDAASSCTRRRSPPGSARRWPRP